MKQVEFSLDLNKLNGTPKAFWLSFLGIFCMVLLQYLGIHGPRLPYIVIPLQKFSEKQTEILSELPAKPKIIKPSSPSLITSLTYIDSFHDFSQTNQYIIINARVPINQQHVSQNRLH